MAKRNPHPDAVLPAGIYRLDLPGKNMDGWNVQVSRNRRVFQKYFANLAHGGEQKALQAAIRYRARILREHHAMTRAEYAAILRKNNTSGVPGVYRTPVKGRKAQWIAFWVPESGGATRSAKFSVARHGEARAKALALAARREALAQMSGAWQDHGERQKVSTPSAPRLPAPDARIRHAYVGAKRLTVTLRDGRLVSVPLWLIPKLGKASAGARQAVRIAAEPHAMEWPALGLRLPLKQLLSEQF